LQGRSCPARTRKPSGPAGQAGPASRASPPPAPPPRPAADRGPHLSSPPPRRARPGLGHGRAATRVRRGHDPPCVARTPRTPRPGYLLRAAASLDPQTEPPCPSCSSPCAAATQNPSPPPLRCPPPSSPARRRGTHPELRKEVSHPPAPLVDIPVHPAALGPSPELHRRAAASAARAAASPPEPWP
jgi:hypothetical protein